MSQKQLWVNVFDHADTPIGRLPLTTAEAQVTLGLARMVLDRLGKPIKLRFYHPREHTPSSSRLRGGQKTSYLQRSADIPAGVWQHSAEALGWHS